MKKKISPIVLCLSILILSFTRANSQSLHLTPKHEINVQVSDGTPLAVVWVIGEAFTSWNKEQINESGVPFHIGAGYMYNLSNKFSIGMELSFQSFKRHYKLTKSGNQDATGKERMNAYLAMPKAKLIYVNGRIIQFYGDLAAGVMMITHTDYVNNSKSGKGNLTTFAFQFNPLALRVGNKIGGFLKLGFGYQGFVTVGASMKF